MTTLRADAQRNLGRILEAASDAYAELGPDVPIDEIARRAGVGHGTVFRRFPTKDALRAAVIAARLDELLAHARELLDQPDAGAALEQFVWGAAEACRRDSALFEGIERLQSFAEVADAKQELNDIVGQLIRRAQRAGVLRRGLDSRDIGALVSAAIQASAHAEREDAWRRYVQVVVDGLRPSGRAGA
jgi:AcrR family transcriptional regulator